MSAEANRRRDARYEVPAVIDSPELSDLPLLAEDVSVGGFRVVVSRKPEIQSVVECSLQVFDELFDRCAGRVVWISDNESIPDTWSVGLKVVLVEGDRQHFAEVLAELGEKFQGAIPPFSFL